MPRLSSIEVPLVFDTAIEGFVRAYRSRLTPELKAEMTSLGIDPDQLAHAYHLEVFERVFKRVGEVLYPELDDTERWRRIGRQFVQGYVETSIGRTLLMFAKALGPRITLEKMARAFRTGSNHVAAEARRLGPAELELHTWMVQPFVESWRGRSTLHLVYRQGILEGTLVALGVSDGTVELVEKDLWNQSARYRIRWGR